MATEQENRRQRTRIFHDAGVTSLLHQTVFRCSTSFPNDLAIRAAAGEEGAVCGTKARAPLGISKHT